MVTAVEGYGRLASRRVAPLVLAVACAVLTVVLGTVAIGSLRLVTGAPVGRAPLPVAAMLTALGLAWWARRRWGARGWWLPAALVATLAAGVLAGAIFLAGVVPDTTYDGQWLHQEAALRLVEGWNPVYSELGPEELPDAAQRARLNGYPKASWIASAAVVGWSGRIDHAGWTTAALAAAGWMLAWVALCGGLGMASHWAIPLSAALTANPVVITQVLNSQVDGDLACCLLVLVLTPWLRAATRSQLVLLAVGAAAILACGFKLTGGLFAGVLLVGAMVASRPPRFDRALAATAVIALGIGGAGLGLHPYVTNLVRHRHPLYPLMGPDAVAILTVPPVGRVESLVAATFSRSRHMATSAEAVAALAAHDGLKPPWSVRRSEIEAFAVPDVRIGGFGPLFGAVVLAALLALGASRRGGGWRILVPLVSVLVSVLIFPQPWFARFVPQLWLLPLVAAAAALVADNRRRRVFGLAVIMLALADAGLVAAGHVSNVVRHGRAVEARLRQLAGDGVLRVDLRPFTVTRARLSELGIPFESVVDPDHSLQTVLGTWLPSIRSATVRDGPAGREIELSWARVRGAARYHVELACDSVGQGQAVPAATFEPAEPGLRAPLPCAAPAVTVRACNQLGCGPPVAVFVASSDR